uniref:NAM-associated domain-containing protein n=1 Tax=Heterorhabditis bacteriophora TaxID=37862 RepID=A0A1I7WY77_HETBA
MSIEDDGYDKKCLEITSQRAEGKIKKPKFVPWEPYKAAPSADRKGKPPNHLPTLIPYKPCLENEVNNNNQDQVFLMVDEKKVEPKSQDDNAEVFRKRKLNRELKRLMVATISDELQGQVQALTEDKIRLAHRVEEYSDRRNKLLEKSPLITL